jgi:hypothetical protein
MTALIKECKNLIDLYSSLNNYIISGFCKGQGLYSRYLPENDIILKRNKQGMLKIWPKDHQNPNPAPTTS